MPKAIFAFYFWQYLLVMYICELFLKKEERHISKYNIINNSHIYSPFFNYTGHHLIKFTCYRTSEIININATSFFFMRLKRFKETYTTVIKTKCSNNGLMPLVVTKKSHRNDTTWTCNVLLPKQADYHLSYIPLILLNNPSKFLLRLSFNTLDFHSTHTPIVSIFMTISTYVWLIWLHHNLVSYLVKPIKRFELLTDALQMRYTTIVLYRHIKGTCTVRIKLTVHYRGIYLW